MNQRARMVKTLLCLALSMTGAAALLGWLDPSTTPSPDALPFATIESVAREAVANAINLEPDRWRDVRVASSPAGGQLGNLLAARADWESSHFFVRFDGHITCGSLWRNQRDRLESPGTIVVEVAQEEPGVAMSQAQWVGVRSLVRLLTETVAPTAGELPVTADNSWQAVYQHVELEPDMSSSS